MKALYFAGGTHVAWDGGDVLLRSVQRPPWRARAAVPPHWRQLRRPAWRHQGCSVWSSQGGFWGMVQSLHWQVGLLFFWFLTHKVYETQTTCIRPREVLSKSDLILLNAEKMTKSYQMGTCLRKGWQYCCHRRRGECYPHRRLLHVKNKNYFQCCLYLQVSPFFTIYDSTTLLDLTTR